MTDEQTVREIIDELLSEGKLEIHPDDRDKPTNKQRIRLTDAGRDELAKLERKLAAEG